MSQAHCDMQAAAPALSAWIIAVKTAGPVWKLTEPNLGSLVLVAGLAALDYTQTLCVLIRTLTLYLDTQQKWKDFKSGQHGLPHFLCRLSASLSTAAELLLDADEQQTVVLATAEVEPYFDVLKTASGFCCKRVSYHP